jgi:hypothetical protein
MLDRRNSRSAGIVLALVFLIAPEPVFAAIDDAAWAEVARVESGSPAAPQTAPSTRPTATSDPVLAPPATTEGTARKTTSCRWEIPKVGIDTGLFLPSSGKTRSRFGGRWQDISIGIGSTDRPSVAGEFSFDFSTLYQRSGAYHLFLMPVGVDYRRAVNARDVAQNRTFMPFYGVSTNLDIVDIRSPKDNVHSRFRLSQGGSAIFGTTIGGSGFLEARYIGVAGVQGFDLSGVHLEGDVRF